MILFFQYRLSNNFKAMSVALFITIVNLHLVLVKKKTRGYPVKFSTSEFLRLQASGLAAQS